MERWSIYGLYDPRKPKEIRVVGKTKMALHVQLKGYRTEAWKRRRRGQHLLPSQVWILKLLDQGIRPSIRLIEFCRRETWRVRERRAITLCRNRGHRLLNVHPGGNGSDDGKRKLICDVCGTRRKQFSTGELYCPNCRRVQSRNFQRTLPMTPKRRTRRRINQRAWSRTPKGRAYYAAWSRTPRRRAYHVAYSSDWHRAKKLGLTVKEFRARRAVQ